MIGILKFLSFFMLLLIIHLSVCPISFSCPFALSLFPYVCLSAKLSVNLRHCSLYFSRKPSPCGWWLANQLIFKKIRRRLGLDRCVEVLAGKYAMRDKTFEFFSSFGITILNVYGISELSGQSTAQIKTLTVSLIVNVIDDNHVAEESKVRPETNHAP